MDHEEAFVSVFVVPEKRQRYLDLLRKPKRRVEITRRFSHLFDFVPELATPIPRNSDLVSLVRNRGAGPSAHIIGGDADGKDMPLVDALHEAMKDPSGVIISCVPGRVALLMQEFPPGDTFILSRKTD
jgi:hypothetical protein